MQAPSGSVGSIPHMRAVIDAVANATSTKEQIFKLIHEFNGANVNRYGEQTKQDFVAAVLKYFQFPGLSDQEKTTALFAVRLCLREAAGTHLFSEKEVLLPLFQLMHLDKAEPESTGLEDEAAKIFANVGLHYKDVVRSLLKDTSSLKHVVAKLKVLNRSSGMLFPVVRLVFFLVSDESDVAVRKEAQEANLTAVLTGVLDSAVHYEWPSNQLVAHECLKVMFLLTIHLGPLKGSQTPPTEQEVLVFQKFVPILADCLVLPGQHADLKGSAVSCMINTPYVCTPFFDPVKTMPGLLRLLEYQLLSSNDVEGLVPTLLVMTSIARDMPTARRILKKALFPIEPEEPAPDAKLNIKAPTEIETQTLGGRIIKHMTSVNPGLNYYANEFIYQVCGENTDEFVRLTGFGNAAGLLQRRGLFGFGQGLTTKGPEGLYKPEATEDFLKAAQAQELQLKKLESMVEEGTMKLLLMTITPKPEEKKETVPEKGSEPKK